MAEPGAEGAVAPPPLADKGANGIKCSTPFCRLSGMMPASTEKNIGICKWKCVKYYPKKCENLLVTTFKILQLLGDFVLRPPNGAAPLDPAGDSRSPRPHVVLPPIPNLLPPPLVLASEGWQEARQPTNKVTRSLSVVKDKVGSAEQKPRVSAQWRHTHLKFSA